MPDGDKVHAGLTGAYQKPYKQICEDLLGDEETSRSILRSLRRDIRRFGDQPIEIINQVAGHLEQIRNAPLLRNNADWAAESSRIDAIAQTTFCSKDALELAVHACKEQLIDFRNGAQCGNVAQEIAAKYMRRMYLAFFEDRVPLPRHYRDVSPAFIKTKLDAIRPLVEQGIAYFAAQAIKNNTMTHLRLESRSHETFDIYAGLAVVS